MKMDGHIAPLVDALNSIPGLTTHYSCHGHFGRPNPWVIFSADDLLLPYVLWKRLKKVCKSYRPSGLKYFWTIKPWFSFYGGRPGFQMVGKPVGHYGFLSRGCLQKETNSLKEMIFLDYQKNSDKDHCKYAGDKQRISIDPTSARIFRIATWTPLSIRSNTASANMTFNELCHEVIYQMGRIKSNRRSEIIITSPLYAGSHLWTIVDILEALNFEDAFKRSPEFEGHFLEGDSVLLKIT